MGPLNLNRQVLVKICRTRKVIEFFNIQSLMQQPFFKTLSDTYTDKDYEVALEKNLNAYFEPQKNMLHETYLFRQARKENNETLAQFHVRLRRLAERCEFRDLTDFEIELQIFTYDISLRLPKRGL